MESVNSEFSAIATRSDLTADHSFDSGDDDGPYFNFTFDSLKPLSLWHEIQTRLYENATTGRHMKLASMAMCSEEDRWDQYLLLFHFDPSERLDATDDLTD